LFERHILGIRQNRIGPNKVRFIGLIQAIIDGLKLLSKGTEFLKSRNFLLYYLIPLFRFVLILLE